jgi:hypothetical protein
MVDDNICFICCDEFDGVETVRVCLCTTQVHIVCFQRMISYLNNHKQCPVCRSNFTLKSRPRLTIYGHILLALTSFWIMHMLFVMSSIKFCEKLVLYCRCTVFYSTLYVNCHTYNQFLIYVESVYTYAKVITFCLVLMLISNRESFYRYDFSHLEKIKI